MNRKCEHDDRWKPLNTGVPMIALASSGILVLPLTMSPVMYAPSGRPVLSGPLIHSGVPVQRIKLSAPVTDGCSLLLGVDGVNLSRQTGALNVCNSEAGSKPLYCSVCMHGYTP
jgi:hypothetical protein